MAELSYRFASRRMPWSLLLVLVAVICAVGIVRIDARRDWSSPLPRDLRDWLYL